MVSRGLTVRGPGCLPEHTAPLGEGGTSCPCEKGEKLQTRTIPLLSIYSRVTVVCLHTYVFTRVHSSAVHNCQKVETTQMSTNEG